MTQSNQSVKVLSGKYKGRAGRVISAYPYELEGAKPGAPLLADVILDADPENDSVEISIADDQLEVL